MTREWQPGDVAMVRSESGKEHLAMVTDARTGLSVVAPSYASDSSAVYAWGPRFARPLVVIDPEDREQVERLLHAYHSQYAASFPGEVAEVQAGDKMQAALREFVDPKPPRPDEPLALGAVVEDADGKLWIRLKSRIGNFVWHSDDHDPTVAKWRGIDVVRVLSDGVSR